MDEDDGSGLAHYHRAPAPGRPSALLGCLTVLVLVAALALGAVSCVAFLDSGADAGELILEQAESYRPGALRYFGESNVFLVRLADGAFVALSDLDQANRAAEGARCRVASASVADAAVAEHYRSVVGSESPAARGAGIVLWESCNNALYDVIGTRLVGPGYNLDRHPVSVLEDGRVAIDLAERECSQRTEEQFRVPVDCP